MPSINLRLTEEEHRELETWARDGRRSIQKEIIFRLFSQPTASATMSHLPPADAQSRDVQARTLPERELPVDKPDPGGTGSIEAPAPRAPSPSYFPEREVKPDFKGKK